MNPSLKNLFVAASMLAVFAVPVFGAKAQVGEPAPNFSLTDITGATHQLSDFAGKTIVLEWVNPECPFVKKHYRSGNLPQLQAQTVADEDKVWLLINSNRPGSQGTYDDAQVEAWMAKHDAAATAYLRDPNGEVGKLYGAKTTPHMYVIDASGTLVYQGAIDSIPSAKDADIAKAHNYVSAALAALNAGEAIEHSSTRAYGCSVKY